MSKCLDFIEEQLIIDLTKRLIKNDSVSGNEKKIATLLAIEMKKAGFNIVQFDEKSNDIIGIMFGLGKGKNLVLVGNIDTVSPGSMANPFDALELDGQKFGTKGKVIYGRGACDMKASLAAMLCAASALKRAHARLKGNFIIVGLANSKNGKSIGLKKILEKFEVKPDYVVSCAPTNLEINVAHPGQATYEISAKGKMSNIGNPQEAVNSILKMNEIINCINKNSILPEDVKFGKANMLLSSIISNPVGESNSVPNFCQALIVRQIFENENPEKIKDDLLAVLKKSNFSEEDVRITLKRFFKAYTVQPSEEIISLLQEARTTILGKPAKLGYWTSGVNLSEIFDIKIPIVGFGPGDEKYSHTLIEHVPIDHLIKATKVYTLLAEKICIQMKEKEQ